MTYFISGAILAIYLVGIVVIALFVHDYLKSLWEREND